MKLDLGPVLGEVGLWCLKCQLDRAKLKKDNDTKKKAQIAIDLIEKYLENEFAVIGQEKKYNFINKFGPKKLPDQQIQRSSVKHIYSWHHYAPMQWYQHVKNLELELKNKKEGKVVEGKMCSTC